MKEKVKKYIKEIFVAIFLIVLFSNALSYYRSGSLNKDSLVLKEVELLDGSFYEIPKDKPIIVHFWATWCHVCKLEASNIQKISKDYEVLTIAVDSGSKEDIKKYLNENELSFKVINDESSFYSKKFNIKVFPTTFIYNKGKNLEFSQVGYLTTAGLYSRMLLLK